MKQRNSLPIFAIAVILTTATISGAYAGYYHYFATDLQWCEHYKPMLNISGVGEDNRISQKCYGELWSEYCKVSYPQHCPT